MMVTTIPRRSLIAAALALFAGGCYSARCEKMGFAEGTPENSRCVYQLQMDMAQQLNAIAQQMQAQQMQAQQMQAQQMQKYSGSSYSGSSYDEHQLKAEERLTETLHWMNTGHYSY